MRSRRRAPYAASAPAASAPRAGGTSAPRTARRSGSSSSSARRGRARHSSGSARLAAGLRRPRRGDAAEGGAAAARGRPDERGGARAPARSSSASACSGSRAACAASSRRPRRRSCSRPRCSPIRGRRPCTCSATGATSSARCSSAAGCAPTRGGGDDARPRVRRARALLGRAGAARGVRAGERGAPRRVGVAPLRRPPRARCPSARSSFATRRSSRARTREADRIAAALDADPAPLRRAFAEVHGRPSAAGAATSRRSRSRTSRPRRATCWLSSAT